LPTKPGVYIFKDENNKTIYIGKARDLRKRVSSYFSNKALETRILKLVSEVKFVDHIIVASEIESFLLESNLIKKHKPAYNVRLTDDKTYPYLEIGKKPIPYVVLTRKPDNKNAQYMGPYTNISDLKIVLRLLRRIFPFQSVRSHPNRRCLYNHIGLCPCIQVFPDRLQEYKNALRHLISFLKGNKDKVIKDLQRQQKEHIKKEEFEKAGEIQRKIEKIGIITSHVYNPFKYEEKPDYYFERVRDEVLSLKKILGKYGLWVNNLNRIECYDISNIQGRNAAGSMVVFTNGDSDKSEYKRFRIKSKKTPDDFEMMREVLRRRLRHDDWDMPDLIVVDGGQGQVSAALQVFAEQKLEIPVIGLAKREEAIIIPVNKHFLEAKLPKSTPGVNLLRRLRDEAHRFAFSYHKLLRKKSLAD
jgi:excinuclease ABC subunit C